MSRQSSLLAEIRRVQTEVTWLMPHRDVGLVRNPGASEAAMVRVEHRLGRALPPSYRAFLQESDGWPRFFEGATLLGTASLGKRTYETLAHAACEAAETPVPDVGPPSRYRRATLGLIPFGIDIQATTLFAFNPSVVRGDGEYQVIAWVNEIGVRRDCFEDFLEFVLELCEADLAFADNLELKTA
jgi:hypothetical protein